MEIDEVIFASLRDAFTNEWKKIEPYAARRPLTKDLAKREKYRKNIVKTFNNICRYLRDIYCIGDLEQKLGCIARIKPYIEKCQKAFEKLQLKYDWPSEDLTIIDIDLVTPIVNNPVESVSENQEPQGSEASSSGATKGSATEAVSSVQTRESIPDADENSESDTDIDKLIQDISARENRIRDSLNETIFEQAQSENIAQASVSEDVQPDENDIPSNSNQNIQTNMVQSKEDFFKTAGPILNYKYEGDPLKLESFIEDAELVETIAATENKALCLKFIKTKISGRAREYMPDEITSVKDISEALRKHIKPDSSLVIEGRLTALRLQKGNFTKFSEEAEKLAEAFRRSLIVEGFTKQKATELTIRKTQELCRRTARSDVVKGIIQSTKYETPSEVISAFITENDTARKEQKEKESFSKNRSNQKFNKNNPKFAKKDQKFNKNNGKFNGKGKFNKNQNQQGQGGGQRNNRNDHVIRIVSDAGPSTSNESNQSNAEQVFRLAPS